jgi:MFS family permease
LETHRNRLFLPVASFLNDFGWELPILLLPLFIVNVLGASALAVGVVEGVADATATVTKVFSGLLADRTGQRKRLTELGYGAANLARPLLFFVTAWPMALLIRFVERVGKGLRTSPRDALLADSVPTGQQGRAFGFLRAMDTAGAFGSMVIGLLLIFLLQGNSLLLQRRTFQWLVVIASISGFAATAIVIFFVKDVVAKTSAGPDLEARAGLPPPFLLFAAVSAIFTLGNSSDAFLILRSQNLGGSALVVVGMMAAFNFVYGAASQPLGRLSDRWGKRPLIIGGWTIYALAYLGFGRANQLTQVALLLLPYGLYYALTEGVGRALVADLVPSGSRGAAFGIYHGALGGSALLASIIAGALYSRVSPSAPFYFGAGLAGVAAVLLMLVPLRRHPTQKAVAQAA